MGSQEMNPGLLLLRGTTIRIPNHPFTTSCWLMPETLEQYAHQIGSFLQGLGWTLKNHWNQHLAEISKRENLYWDVLGRKLGSVGYDQPTNGIYLGYNVATKFVGHCRTSQYIHNIHPIGECFTVVICSWVICITSHNYWCFRNLAITTWWLSLCTNFHTSTVPPHVPKTNGCTPKNNPALSNRKVIFAKFGCLASSR